MDQLNMTSITGATVGSAQSIGDIARIRGRFTARCVDADGNLLWEDAYHNLVTDAGAKDILDKYFSGSGYTAAHFLGLISSVSYTAAPVVGDTMTSHTGWTEAGGTNAPTFSQTARPSISWSGATGSGAGARTKAMSVSATFNFTGAGTVKGSFVTTSSTKDGTAGTLVSGGVFSGGDQVVSNGATLTVSYQLSL
jgi:hypothetical protein